MILFWGALIAFIVWVVMRFNKRCGSEFIVSYTETHKGRYAKGEISKEEFEQLQ